ncbi:hypothetical protein CSA56_07670 [candidate division KSB3 bacterium]|uniref:Glutaredoxin n=1 Tax=candidate division KSB3 bacterium TaxID=2044937 RepID=A0A2G6KHC9_9BACT|nr:MAG: hypothetical protein CSA56_07670 [candidate division KSB3 bacterium]
MELVQALLDEGHEIPFHRLANLDGFTRLDNRRTRQNIKGGIKSLPSLLIGKTEMLSDKGYSVRSVADEAVALVSA